MGGVDRFDQKIKPYECLRKSVRWYMKLFFHLMDITIMNAHIVYKKSGGEKCSLLQFRHKVLSVQRTRQTWKAVKTYYNVLPKMLCRTLHWAVF
jgi:hypothetical protein